MAEYQEDGPHQDQLVRDMALKRAVEWADWPGCRANTVTDVAIVFEHYLTTGEVWALDEEEPIEHGTIE